VRTGEYGSLEEIQENPPLEYRFNPNSRCFESKVVSFEKNRWHRNRGIIDTVKSILPELSDSMALVLYSDVHKVTYPLEVLKWTDMAVYLLDHGWRHYSDGTYRDQFLNQLRLATEARNKELHRKRKQEQERIRKAESMRWLLSWLIPVGVLGSLLVILLIVRQRISSRLVTSHRVDRIITYFIYLLAIGIALYFAWSYLGLTG
jgi:hypothetical protein